VGTQRDRAPRHNLCVAVGPGEQRRRLVARALAQRAHERAARARPGRVAHEGKRHEGGARMQGDERRRGHDIARRCDGS
jgi:hypothetical protein